MTTTANPDIKYLRVADDHIFHSNGKVYHVTPEHPFHAAIQKLAEQEEYAAALKLCDPKETIALAASAVLVEPGVAKLILMANEPPKPEPKPVTTLFNEAIETDLAVNPIRVRVNSDGEVIINDNKPDRLFSKVIFDRLNANRPFDDLIKFYIRLSRNTAAPEVKQRLFEFLQKGNYPILPDGRFIAFKGLHKTENPVLFAASHDRSFLYELQTKTRVPRDACELDPDKECAPGLHVGHHQYARGYGDTFCEVIVDPIDVIRCPGGADQKVVTTALLLYRVQPHGEQVPSVTYWEGDPTSLPADPEHANDTGLGGDDVNDSEDGHDEDEQNQGGTDQSPPEPVMSNGSSGESGVGVHSPTPSVAIAAGVDFAGPEGDRSVVVKVPAPAGNPSTTEQQLAGGGFKASKVPEAPNAARAPQKAGKPTKRTRGPGRTYYRLTNRNRSIESKRFNEHPGKPWTSHRDALEAQLDKKKPKD